MRGARVFGVLLRNEWFKARKRVAFWLPLGFYTLTALANHTGSFIQRDAGFRLPEVWSRVFAEESSFALIFATLTLLLLTATEFNWRTARQNVIDGFSKSQWVAGKLLLLLIVGLLFIAVHILVPVILAVLRTDFATVEGPLVPASAFAAAAGLVLSYLSTAGFAFFLALTIRRTATAIGVWFAWAIPIESGMMTPLALRYFPEHSGLIEYLPWLNTLVLRDYAIYDIAAVTIAREAGSRMPPPVDPTVHLLVATAWTVVFIVAGFIWFLRRDL